MYPQDLHLTIRLQKTQSQLERDCVFERLYKPKRYTSPPKNCSSLSPTNQPSTSKSPSANCSSKSTADKKERKKSSAAEKFEKTSNSTEESDPLVTFWMVNRFVVVDGQKNFNLAGASLEIERVRRAKKLIPNLYRIRVEDFTFDADFIVRTSEKSWKLEGKVKFDKKSRKEPKEEPKSKMRKEILSLLTNPDSISFDVSKDLVLVKGKTHVVLEDVASSTSSVLL